MFLDIRSILQIVTISADRKDSALTPCSIVCDKSKQRYLYRSFFTKGFICEGGVKRPVNNGKSLPANTNTTIHMQKLNRPFMFSELKV